MLDTFYRCSQILRRKLDQGSSVWDVSVLATCDCNKPRLQNLV